LNTSDNYLKKKVPYYILNLTLALLIMLNIPNYTYTPQVILVHPVHLWAELFTNYMITVTHRNVTQKPTELNDNNHLLISE